VIEAENSWGHKGPWEWSSYDGMKCAHSKHQEVSDDWLLEPCEKCGCDIAALDYEEAEFEDLVWPMATSVIQTSAPYYILHPCGHIMHSLQFWKVK
jgi:hypothetical protein